MRLNKRTPTNHSPADECYPPLAGKPRRIRGWKTFFSAGHRAPTSPRAADTAHAPSAPPKPPRHVAQETGSAPEDPCRPAQRGEPHASVQRPAAAPQLPAVRKNGKTRVKTWPWDPTAYPVRTPASPPASEGPVGPTSPTTCVRKP